MLDNIVALMPLVQAGKVRALAVSSARRHPLLPEVPSIQEGGVKDFETVAWFGFVAPAATPREVVARLNAEILRIIRLPAVEKRLIDPGSVIVRSSPQDADRFLREEVEKWGRVVRTAKVTAN